jgi:hypothetical protein
MDLGPVAQQEFVVMCHNSNDAAPAQQRFCLQGRASHRRAYLIIYIRIGSSYSAAAAAAAAAAGQPPCGDPVINARLECWTAMRRPARYKCLPGYAPHPQTVDGGQICRSADLRTIANKREYISISRRI